MKEKATAGCRDPWRRFRPAIDAAVMVLTRCSTTDEAYRAIEWKAIFLIAGMLPLGTALDPTGAANLIAEGVVGVTGGLGPIGAMFGLVFVLILVLVPVLWPLIPGDE